MPNAPKTPLRAVRLDDEMWRRLAEAAEARGTDRSEVIRAAITLVLATPAFTQRRPLS